MQQYHSFHATSAIFHHISSPLDQFTYTLTFYFLHRATVQQTYVFQIAPKSWGQRGTTTAKKFPLNKVIG